MLRQLGVLPVEFPKVGQFSPDSQAGKSKVDKVSAEDKKVTEQTMFQPRGQCDPESHLPCQCPMRTVVEVPEKLPMAAVPENRKKLEDLILGHLMFANDSPCQAQLVHQ